MSSLAAMLTALAVVLNHGNLLAAVIIIFGLASQFTVTAILSNHAICSVS